MRLRPLTGCVLLQVLPAEKISPGNIALPDEMPLSPEAVQAGHRHPTPPAPLTCIVRAIGKWPVNRKGLMRMPEYGVGARVIVRHNAGIQMERSIGQNYRMVNQSEVLAVLCK